MAVTPTPKFSVITAVFNGAANLEICLQSVADQRGVDVEHIVIDGGSTDGCVEILERWSNHLAYWQSRKDKGIYDAWNQALAHAKGEYVCFLGADDVWSDNDALARLFSAIGQHRYDLVTSRGRIERATGTKPLEFGAAWNFDRIGRRMLVCHPGLLHRRSLFDEYGMFDSKFRITGDLDFLLRLPEDITTLHVDAVTVLIDAAGISRQNVMARLREQRIALARCPRYGPFRARLAWLDKLWRYPIARIFDIPH